MMIRPISFLCAMVLLCGCHHSTLFKNPPINDPSDDASIRLAEAATSINDAMLETAKVEKVIYPAEKERLVRIPNAYALQSRASVDWSGPIEEITDKITQAAHYRLRIMGGQPPVPILISLHAKDQSLGEILRNIDYQAGKRANIHVYPNSQVVELRYAKIYS